MIEVYAYGVRLVDSGAWLHYWIERDLTYHEEVCASPQIPKLLWVNNKFNAQLFGPGDFMITHEK